MNEALEEITVENNSQRFSKFSLIFSLLTTGILVYLFIIIPATISAKTNLTPSPPPMVIDSALYFFSLIGAVMSILSFKEREKSSWYKWIGGILNLTTFLLILTLILWVNLGPK